MTNKGIRCHASDFLGTTLWSSDTKGNIVDSYSDTSVFGEGSIQHDRSARFTGKPYDEDLQAFVFPFRNYKPDLARWTSSDPAGFPDGINNHFYACVPTMSIDPWGLYGINFTTNPTNTNSSSYTADKAVYDGGNKLVGSKDDSFYVTAHGDKDGIYDSVGKIDVNKLAESIKSAEGYDKCIDVRLLACDVGIGNYAQDLANLLGKDVLAADGIVELSADGFFIIKDKDGKWKKYQTEK